MTHGNGKNSYDVIVAGGGHAGCEAALAAARLGMNTLMLNLGLTKIANLSCNPAVGGLAKGHLVKEIDALGGWMALVTDSSAIQYRLLNRAKGPAVWSSRAQVDIDLYPQNMQKVLKAQNNLSLADDEVTGLLLKNGRAVGVRTGKSGKLGAKAVVITSGTFLRGIIHIGEERIHAGRINEPPSDLLSENLNELGFKISRLKTGTPPRLEAASLDLDQLEIQNGDDDPRLFSFMSKEPVLPQTHCRLTRTTEETHQLIRDNLHLAPMYAGRITGVGARYCPSLEDKVVRFAERESHQVFLEPQGLNNPLVYPNGISTGLPLEIQEKMVRTLPGCSRAVIRQPGYAIEYDYADPRDLKPSLESKLAPGVFLAGQVNGTSGYEEASAQGLMAGINAALAIKGLESFVLDRSQAYIGVLIDDLITKGTKEPYRMFTSRAEYRLTLREDNADLRLTPLGRDLGLVGDERWRSFGRKKDSIENAWSLLEKTALNPTSRMNLALEGLGSKPLRRPQNAAEILRRPELGLEELATLHPDLQDLVRLEPEVARQLVIKAHYSGYEDRERETVQRFKERESVALPPDMDYLELQGLSREVREKLDRVRPLNLGQAGRISGVTPAALGILSLHLHRRSAKRG